MPQRVLGKTVRQRKVNTPGPFKRGHVRLQQDPDFMLRFQAQGRGMRRFFCCILIAALLICAAAMAQVVGATLIGRVTDPSGAAVPDAKVTIRNLATGVVAEAISNNRGLYFSLNLLPG